MEIIQGKQMVVLWVKQADHLDQTWELLEELSIPSIQLDSSDGFLKQLKAEEATGQAMMTAMDDEGFQLFQQGCCDRFKEDPMEKSIMTLVLPLTKRTEGRIQAKIK